MLSTTPEHKLSLDRCRVEVVRPAAPLAIAEDEKHRNTTSGDPPPGAPARAHAPSGPAASRHAALVGCLPESRPRRPRRLIQPATLSRTAHVSAAARRATPDTPRRPTPRPRALPERLTDNEHCSVAAEYATADVLAAERTSRRGRDCRAPP